MSITGITGTGRISPPSTDPPAVAAPSLDRAGASAAVAEPELDQVTQQPVPPRFPWLSRLTQQLESASHQRAAFPAAPALGDHLDRSA